MTPSTRRLLFLAALLVPATLAVQKEELPPSVAVVLKGHTEAVYAVAYTPDGKHVVTGSFDRSIRIWDAASGQEVRNYSGTQGHTNLVLSLAINAEGTQIASGGADNTARVWDFPTSKAVRNLALADAGTAVALRPDGQHLAAAGKDGLIKVWNTADGKEVFTLKGHTGAVLSLNYSPNSQTLVSGGADGTLRAWNAANGQPAGVIGHPGEVRAAQVLAGNNGIVSAGADGVLRQWTLPIPASRATTAHAGDVTAIALSPDNSQIYTAGTDKVVRVSSFANGTLTRTLQGPNAAVQCLSVSGGLVVAGTADGQVFLWNANDGKLSASFQAHALAVEAVSLSPASNQLLTAGKDGRLRTWTLPINPTRLVKTNDEPRAAALSPDGKRLWVAGKDRVLRGWNFGTSQFDRQLPGHESAITALAVQASGQLLASGDESGQVRLWTQSDGKAGGVLLAHAGAVQSLAFHPSGQQLLSTGADGTLKVWSLSVKPVAPIPAKEAVLTAVLSPDGSRVVTGEKGGKVRTWVIAGGQNERTFEGLKADPACLAVAGTRLAAGAGDPSILIWNADGKLHKTIAGLQAVPRALLFSADGKQLLAGLADGSIRLLDVEQGKESKKFPAHKGAVTALALTPGGVLVSAGADNSVKTWKLADFSAVATLSHDQPLTCLALSRDGTRVAAGSSAKTIRVWTLADGKPVATLTTPAEVRSLAFIGDGTRLLAGGSDGLARVFDLRGNLLEQFKHDAAVAACLSLPDGKRFITAGLDKTIRLQEPALVWSGAHERGPTLAQFNARGDRVVSGGADKTIRLWNAADGKELKSLTLAGAVAGLSLTGDGNRAFLASTDGKVSAWTFAPTPADKPAATFTLPATPGLIAVNSAGTRLAVTLTDGKGATTLTVLDGTTGKELQSISEVSAAVSALSFQADGRTLLAASADRHVRLVDVAVVNAFEAHSGGVKEAVFRNDGKQILAGGADRKVKMWDSGTGKEVKTFATLAEPISALAFSRDYTLVAAAAGKVVKVWNEATARETLNLPHPAAVTGLSFNGDRSRLATACADGRVRLFDVASGRELEAFVHTGTPRGVVYHAGNAAVIAGGTDKLATIHPLRLTRIVGTSEGASRALAVHPNGQHVIVAGDGKTARIWNLGNNNNPERTLLGSGGALNAVAVTRNGALVATAGEDRTVRLYTFNDARPVGTFKTAGVVRALSFSGNNQTLAAACADGAILTWNVAYTPGQPVPESFGKRGQAFSHEGAVQDVAFAPDNVTLCTTGVDRSVRLWRFATDAPTRTFQHPNIVNAVAFNKDGTLLATACHDGQVRIYDVVKNTLVRTIQAHNRPAVKAVYCLAFSPDGKQLLSGSEDQTLKLWDPATGNLLREFKAHDARAFPKGHRDAVYCLAFSPDGKTVASGGADRTVKLWNVADGSVQRELVNPAIKVDAGEPGAALPGYVYAVRFTADGKKLLSVGHAPGRKGSLSLWSVPDGKLLHAEEMTLGQFYAAVLSPDGKHIAVGVGPRTGTGLGNDEGNPTYLLKAPAR